MAKGRRWGMVADCGKGRRGMVAGGKGVKGGRWK